MGRIPRCICGGGVIKPDVVLYDEPLNSEAILQAGSFVRRADLLIIGGTSLNVYPAAGLINHFKGEKLVVINQTPISADDKADIIIREPIGNVFGVAFSELFN